MSNTDELWQGRISDIRVEMVSDVLTSVLLNLVVC